MNVFKIAHLAEKLAADEEKSVFQLTREANFDGVWTAAEIKCLLSELKRDPKLLNYWLQYSDDKRAEEGWFFRKSEASDGFEVAQFKDGEVLESRFFAGDWAMACALFIRNELSTLNYDNSPELR